MRWLLAIVLLVVPSCGPDARRLRAEDALETTRRVVTEIESSLAASSGGEASGITAALEDTNARLLETEHAYDLWGGATGSMAFERMAACLSVALGELADALAAQHREIPSELETAEAEMASFTERRCRR